MLRETMESAGLHSFAVVALVLFTITFLLIVVWALLKPSKDVDEAARLPLENGEETNHV